MSAQCRFQQLHCCFYPRVSDLDVVLSSHLNVGMKQDSLNGEVINSQLSQVRSQTTAKSMPAVPLWPGCVPLEFMIGTRMVGSLFTAGFAYVQSGQDQAV